MNNFEKKRLFSSIVVILRNNINIEIPKILSDYFLNLDFKHDQNIDLSKIKKYTLDKRSYDDDIMSIIKRQYNNISNITDILHEVYNLKGLSTGKEFEKILDNNFISIRIKRDVLNNLNFIYSYESKNRKVTLISDKYEESLLKDVLSIFDLFDIITGKVNYYNLNIYMSNLEKKINDNVDYLNGDNINSGSTLPGFFITLWRKEELEKVLIHELVHYLKIDMYNYQYKFYVLYKDIKLEDHKCNPNEAYTEFIALLIFTFWRYKKKNISEKNMIRFFKTRLLIELGWSYFQIGKILNFFKCYRSYNDLFGKSCTFNQKTNVLSYFILKTYFLKNLKNTIDCINFKTFKQNEILTNKLLQNVNLHEEEFTEIINWSINYYNKTSFKSNHCSLRMTCLD